MPKYVVQVEWTSTVKMEIEAKSLSLAMERVKFHRHGGTPMGTPTTVHGTVRANSDKTFDLNPPPKD